jgi:hypothetical protein
VSAKRPSALFPSSIKTAELDPDKSSATGGMNVRLRSQLTPTRSYSPIRARPRLVYFDAPLNLGRSLTGFIGNFVAVGEEKSRQIVVHAGEKGKLEKGVAAIELDAAAGIGAAVGWRNATRLCVSQGLCGPP